MNILTLIPALREEIGDLDASHYEWTQDKLMDLLERAIEYDYNEDRVAQKFSISGTGDSRSVSPTPTAAQKELLLTYGALRAINSELAKYARSAVSYSSPLGTKNLTKLFDSFKQLKKELENKRDRLLHTIWHDDMIDDGIESREMSISDPSSVTTESVVGLSDDDILEEVISNY